MEVTLVPETQIMMSETISRQILVVEDDQYNVELFQSMLSDFNVLVAIDGRSALKCFAENPGIELILMDIGLPDISGLEVTSTIRASGADIPILALTAFVGENDILNSKNAGCNDFISKPVDTATLIQKVKQHLQDNAFKNLNRQTFVKENI
ncbi:MAG: response regulator [Bacteroidales bacterium]|nr:response regulator [Bacteroidales bacterium]